MSVRVLWVIATCKLLDSTEESDSLNVCGLHTLSERPE